ncbi:MAG: FecR domain-containing protein [Chloroflexi bacterium]|nr:FecR domain-containing protein [Chloroflexota bacterium]
MTHSDDLLQEKLEALEGGAPLEAALAGLPPESAGEAAALLRLAYAVRAMPHPQPARVGARQRVLTAARAGRPPGKFWLAGGFLGVALALSVAALALFSMNLWLSGPRTARAAELAALSGAAWVAPAYSTAGWQPLQPGAAVRAGQRLRTGADSSLTLAFYDGSRMTLGANTLVTLQALEGGWDRSLQVEVVQHSGATSHSIVPLRGDEARYIVRTPSSSASVRGTQFDVLVSENGAARYSVESGSVQVSAEQEDVLLAAGQATLARPGQPLAQPAYQFTLLGEAEQVSGDLWSVDAVAFQVNAETALPAGAQSGALVRVDGRILDGERIADQVTVLHKGKPEASFTGVLEVMDREAWLVSGVTIYVDGNTRLDKRLEVGRPARVTFARLEDGRWLALKIKALKEALPAPVEITVTPTATFTATLTVSPTLTPITPGVTPTSTLAVDCTGASPHPKAVDLAAEYGVTSVEIMGWFCQHYGFGEIDLAYGLSRQYGLPVEQIFALRASGLGWGEIKKQAAAATPGVTPTPPPPGAEQTPGPKKDKRACPPSQPNPGVERLAGKYGVSYEAVIGYYCQGHSLGDIEHAFKLSAESGAPVSDILALRASGLGWGQIEAQLKPKDKQKP